MKNSLEFHSQAFEESIQRVVATRAADGDVLDVGYEARQISRKHNVPVLLVARELFKHAIQAHVTMDVPLAKDLPPGPLQ